jgi:hypothetical protein
MVSNVSLILKIKIFKKLFLKDSLNVYEKAAYSSLTGSVKPVSPVCKI